MDKIQMVDLKKQFYKIKDEIYKGLDEVFETTQFINGNAVKTFTENLKEYTGANNVIPCANGTDAIQVALMALNLEPGDEILVPAWTYIATAEVIALLRLKPIFVDADPNTFNINTNQIEQLITPKTKAIVPVHLYGQCCDMENLLLIAKKHNLTIIEDTAQSIGSIYSFSDGTKRQAGTIGEIGTTSFFPSKNLGCYGDGGAIFSNIDSLAHIMRGICHHGEIFKKYHHDIVGCNSRLDTIQAVILNAKLKHLDSYISARQNVAKAYDEAFSKIEWIQTPYRDPKSTHVFHQYTLKIKNGKRDELKKYLESKDIPSMIYYPMPLHFQKAYKHHLKEGMDLKVSEQLAKEVLSLPIHTEMETNQLEYIINSIQSFNNI